MQRREIPTPLHFQSIAHRGACGKTRVVPPSASRSDRLYPVRLLVVIVVAALIGSILVLLLR